MRYILSILILLPIISYGQENLVPNPSFEEYSDCPNTGGEWFKVLYWSNGNISSPDYFNVCGPPMVIPPDTFPRYGVPSSQFGYQMPESGNAYMGLYGVQLGNQEVRDYIQTELNTPLYKRIRYVVSFYVSLSENSRYAISTLGAYLSDYPISSNDLLVLDAEPQILNDPLQLLTDTAEWMLVTDTFVSRDGGGEKFITIGNFFSDAESDTVFVNAAPPLGARHAYYYIDDVSVIALDSVPNGIAEAEQLSFSVYPNPVKEVLRYEVRGVSGKLVEVRVLDAVGRLCGGQFPLTKGVSASGGRGIFSGEVDMTRLPPGIYFLELTTDEGRKAVRKFVKQ
jgi:hypothetical protein